MSLVLFDIHKFNHTMRVIIFTIGYKMKCRIDYDDLVDLIISLTIPYTISGKLELLHNREGEEGTLTENFVLEITPLGVKTCGESEFKIYEAKKRFPDSWKACLLKRKDAKIAFL